MNDMVVSKSGVAYAGGERRKAAGGGRERKAGRQKTA
jgi:hypothetical protein